MATSDTELQQFLSSNMKVTDSLQEHSCYDPIRRGGKLVSLKRVSCDLPGAKCRPVTITETDLNKVAVRSGDISCFSADGSEALHVQIGTGPTGRPAASKPTVNLNSAVAMEAQARMARFDEPGYTQQDEEAWLLAGKVMGNED